MNVLAVGLGGFIGAISRYYLVKWIGFPLGFPWATLVANLMGCLLLGWFITYTTQFLQMDNRFRLLVGTGAIGSFTTFSTFSVETLMLIQNDLYVFVLIYITSTIIGGILLSAAGLKLAQRMTTKKRKVRT